jgi:hypothetical protein
VDARQLSARAAALAVAAALVAGAIGGALLAASRDGGDPPDREAAAVGLPSVDLAVQAQRLQAALAAYAVTAQTIASPRDARLHRVQLQRGESAIADVAREAGRIAARVRGRAPAAAERQRALGRTAAHVRARAAVLREAAQAGGGDGEVLALVTYGGTLQRSSARLASLLGVLAASADAGAFRRTMTAIEREIAAVDPGASPSAAGDAATAGDTPVPEG